MAEALRLQVRTPEGAVLDTAVRSVRVPTDTGQVGLRPRSETAALVVEPGLVLAHAVDGLHFVATAGGLLRCDGRDAVLLSPLAVVGPSADLVRARLEEAMRTSSVDAELRRVLLRLESGILQELRRGPAAARDEAPGG